MAVVFKNNAKTTLSAGITASATSITVSDGSVFPSLSGGDVFFLTLDDGTNNEIVKCTAISTNTLTVVRAQESTTARTFSSGDAAELRITAGILGLFSQTGAAITDEIEAYLDANGTTFPDNIKAQFGAGNDFGIKHDGSHTYLQNSTGHVYFQQLADDMDIVFQSDDGSGGVTPYITIDGSASLTKFNINTKHLDNVKATFGDSGDLEIKHTGNHSYITDTGTGNLYIRADSLDLRRYANGEQYLTGDANGAVTLFYDGVAKLATKSDGVDITGELQSDSLDVDGNADISGTISSGAITSSGSITSGGTLTGASSELLRRTVSGWTVPTQTVLGSYYGSNIGDYIYLKAPGNSTTAHGVALVTDNAFYYGRDNRETGQITNNATSPLNESTGFKVTYDGDATFAGELEAASFSDGTISGITFVDEDNMSSNSATKVPTQQSVKAYVDAEVAGVVDSAPAALNTLNELAAALGDDANFSTTTSTALGNRLRVDVNNQGLTGTQQANAITNLGITATKAELNKLDGVTATTAELNYVDGVTSNIQTQLDGKQASGSYLTGNQTITLSGDVSGSGTTSISVTVADDSHNHVISNVDGLQTALDAKLPSSSYTASDVLTKIKTVDGSGSGLDADLLDGVQGSSYLRSDANDTFTGQLTVTGSISSSSNVSCGFTSGSQGQQLEPGNTAVATLRFDADRWRVYAGGSGGADEVFTIAQGGNIGIGRSAPSDKLDVNGSISLKNASATAANFLHLPRGGGVTFYGDASGQHSITSRNQSGTAADDILIGSYGAVYIDLDSNDNNSAGADFIIGRHSATNQNIFIVNGERSYVGSYPQIRAVGWYGSQGSSATGPAAEIGVSSSRAHLIGYDRDSSAYIGTTIAGSNILLDPRSSYVNITGSGAELQMDGTKHLTGSHDLGNISKFYLSNNFSGTYINASGNYLQIQTASGYTRIGANNSSYSHFYTDRGNFYFNKRLTVDEGIISSYNEDLQLRRTNSSNDRINIGDTVIQFFLDGSEDMRLTNTGNLDVEGDVTAYSTVVASDERLKDDVVTIENAVDKVSKLRGVEFVWNKGKREGKQDIGVIAQEVEKVLPEVVIEKELPLMEEGTTYKTVDYPKLTAVLIEAIKEQQKEIEQLKKHSHPAKDMCDMNGYEELVARIEKMEKNYGNN